jgi:hypothetical protein
VARAVAAWRAPKDETNDNHKKQADRRENGNQREKKVFELLECLWGDGQDTFLRVEDFDVGRRITDLSAVARASVALIVGYCVQYDYPNELIRLWRIILINFSQSKRSTLSGTMSGRMN